MLLPFPRRPLRSQEVHGKNGEIWNSNSRKREKTRSGGNIDRNRQHQNRQIEREGRAMMAEQYPEKSAKTDFRKKDRKPAESAEATKKAIVWGRWASHRKSQEFPKSLGWKRRKEQLVCLSLFTSNKGSEILKESTGSLTSYSTSNAPLQDDSYFAGLGLNDRLVTHLTGPMRYMAPTKSAKSRHSTNGENTRRFICQGANGFGKPLRLFFLSSTGWCPSRKRSAGKAGCLPWFLRLHVNWQKYILFGVGYSKPSPIVPGIVVGGEKKKIPKGPYPEGCQRVGFDAGAV